eukprot:CAMPEP_0177648812 /NCGR_PEP_ID=MMETSP0447-20121125/11029_1 /TAXON_ID=0 /ORGANISM="Stygamoeba regulata, Strain BSH-02190019" /LENGTH=285 /DNA_ID=CAMNT_0019151481 /DNA_START=75 /DNA_END=932 /DNA_ORIENTATION=-
MATFGQKSSMRWGDAADAEEETLDTTPYETDWDENGIKQVVTFEKRLDGTIAKTIKTVRAVKKVKRVNKNVERRRTLKRFGECSGKPTGPEPGVSMIAQPTKVILPFKSEKSSTDSDITSIALKLLHARLNPDQPSDPSLEDISMEDRLKAAALLRRNNNFGLLKKDRPSEDEQSGPDGPSKYVPPSQRRGQSGGSATMAMDEAPTIRVTNISDEVTENELRDIFSRCGALKRVYLAKDPVTLQAKGYAFISYHYAQDAKRAMEELAGFGLHHLILNLDWARPRS